jgi:ABC-type nitrate/sulfonate/bicarbonate transport system substrate-binding protein
MFMTRRRFFLLAWALFCFFTGYTITAALAAERVVMASLSPGLFEFPVQVAMMRGYFRDEGLDVVKVQMQPQISVMALVAGDVDYSLSWGSSLRAAITGVPLRVVAGIASRPLHVLMARPEIQSGKDLKDKRVGVDSFAGTMEYLARVAAKHYGLDPNRDIKILISGSSPNRVAALKAGAIDATPIDIAFAVKAEEEGLKRLVNLADIVDLPISGVAVLESKLIRERTQVRKVLGALIKATRFMKENRQQTVKMMADFLGVTSGQAAKAYDVSIKSFTDDGMIADKGLALNVELTKERLNITKDIPLSQIVDWSLIKELKRDTGKFEVK